MNEMLDYYHNAFKIADKRAVQSLIMTDYYLPKIFPLLSSV